MPGQLLSCRTRQQATAVAVFLPVRGWSERCQVSTHPKHSCHLQAIHQHPLTHLHSQNITHSCLSLVSINKLTSPYMATGGTVTQRCFLLPGHYWDFLFPFQTIML